MLVQAENSNAWESIGDEKSPANALLPFHGTTSQNVTVKLKEKALLRCLLNNFETEIVCKKINISSHYK